VVDVDIIAVQVNSITSSSIRSKIPSSGYEEMPLKRDSIAIHK